MMKFSIFWMILILSNSAWGNQLNCWDCDPQGENKCLSPTLINTKTTLCEDATSGGQSGVKTILNEVDKDDVEPRAENLGFECYTFYYQSDNVKEDGLFRGCWKTDPAHIKSTCDFIKEEMGNITNCETCSSDLCNTPNLPRNTDTDNPDSASGIIMSITLLFICITLNYIVRL